MNLKTITHEELKAAVLAQGVPYDHFAFICPMCGTVQSADDLIKASAGKDFDDVEKYLGFSCIGRFTGMGPPSKARATAPGKGCNWTLGGLFRMHKLEVITEDGKRHPHFEVATPEQAQEHMNKKAVAA